MPAAPPGTPRNTHAQGHTTGGAQTHTKNSELEGDQMSLSCARRSVFLAKFVFTASMLLSAEAHCCHARTENRVKYHVIVSQSIVKSITT